jgi:XTP/dITP diphosphohydrolase
MTLLIATNNKHKAAEIKEILRGKFSRIYTAKEMGIDVEPEENGATFFDNAMINAKAVFSEYLKGKTVEKIEEIESDNTAVFAENSIVIKSDCGANLTDNTAVLADHNKAVFAENSTVITSDCGANLTDNIAVLADDSGLCVDYLDGAPGVYSARYAGENCSYADNNKKLLNALKNAENRKARFVCSMALLFEDGSYLVGEGCSEGEILRESAGQNGFGYDPIFYSYDLKKTFSEISGEEKNSVSHRGRALSDLLSKIHF